ncbi:MAG TPA: ATP-binding protein [Streptosporangiaceae bacterium]
MNRADELAVLRSWWERSSSRPALVWGRRRVGKTALLQHFATQTKVPVVFHTGTGEAPGAEIATLCRQTAAVLPDRYRDLAAEPYADWRDILDYLARAAENSPVLLVLDEFPELIKASPALPGLLRAFLDRVQGRTQLKIVLSGSAIRTVEEMRQYRAPLYGRFDLTLQLHPFRPHEAALMLSELSPADRARVYGIVGGNPLYLSWWNQRRSVTDNLFELVGRPGAPLLTEGQLVMATEVGEGEHTMGVLTAIVAGRTKHSEIKDAVGVDPSRTLDRLVELRIIERVLPVTEQESRSRRRIYRIADNYLAFYLGPITRFRAEIERGLGKSIIRPLSAFLDDHMGAVFEESFRDYLRRLANQGSLGEDIVAIGSWWGADSQNEIDAVVLAQRGLTKVPVLVGESKWTSTVDARRLTASLVRKAAALVPDAENLRYSICARDSVEHADDSTLAVTAKDIFGA